MRPELSPDERQRLLLQAAAELESVEERKSFLEATCHGGPLDAEQLLKTVTLDPPVPSTGSTSLEESNPGQLIGGRFQILRKLGEGGMGVVYEAFDTKLMERRALKVPKSGRLDKLANEARSALRVTHQNICRTHEIHTTPTPDGPADFISMELLEGETLLSRWGREPLSNIEALDIARQLCRGLNAAHSAGVLHQDLKSNNVMLTRLANGERRVAITDFGLALPLGDKQRGAKTRVAGTPNYIAPERWNGEPASVATDIYSLGVILYEMLAGRLPFPRETAWTQRLTSLPEPPSHSPRRPDGRWDAIVLRCLEPDPAKRFQSVAAVLASIDRAFSGIRRRSLLGAAAIIVAALAPVFAFRERIWPPALVRLAILPFSGVTAGSDLDHSLKGALYDFANRMQTLGSSQRMVVIPFEESARSGAETPGAAAALLGATHVLTGAASPGEAGFSLRVSVIDVRTGQTLRDFTGDFQPSDVSVLPNSLSGVITSAFHFNKPPPSTVNAAAYSRYAAGLAALRDSPARLDDAIYALEQATSADPTSAAVYAGLADAHYRKYSATGDSRHLAEARTAVQRAQALQPDSAMVLVALGSIEETDGQPERAIELFQRAAALEPNNPEVWRRNGLVLQRIGRHTEAIGSLRRSVQVAPDYYLPHQSLGFALFQAGRYSEAANELRDATRLAPGSPEAYAALGGVLLTLQRDGEAETTLRRSIQLRATRSALNNLGMLLVYERRDREAIDLFRRALNAGAEDAGLRLNLALALRRSGQSAQAREQFDRAGSFARQALLRDPRDAVARARLSYVLLSSGNASVAADEALQAIRIAPQEYLVVLWCVMTMEGLQRRDEALRLLSGASYQRLKDLSRQPDLAGLAHDPRFSALLKDSERRSHGTTGN